MNEKAKIRINLNAREIEIEGPEEFINKYSEIIENYLNIIKTPSIVNHSPQLVHSSSSELQKARNLRSEIGDSSSDLIPDSFGEYYSKFPKSMKDVDKILVAGYFAQQKGGGSFSTPDASSLLIEQGVKLTNAAAFLKANLDSRKLFKHDGKYRISEFGIEYLKKLPQ